MKRKHDWQSTLARHWGKTPVQIPAMAGTPAVSVEQAFRVLVTASEPFRAGLRFYALPDVRFHVGSERIPASGELLPNADDHTAASYCRRVASLLPSEPFQLLVEQPLLLDFPLWAKVHGWLQGVFERVGWPALPITAQMSLGNYSQELRGPERPPGCAVMTWIVHGNITTRLSRSGGRRNRNDTVTLHAEAGALLYWPAHFSYFEEGSGDALALRLWIPTDEAHAVLVTMKYLHELMQQRVGGDHPVPHVSFPPPLASDGSLIGNGPLLDDARSLEQLVRDPALRGSLRVRWAKRVSACGLEPVPDPRPHRGLRRTDRIRASSGQGVIRMRDGAAAGEWIWAVHGHAFAVPEHPLTRAVLAWLASGEESRVDSVCGKGGRREVDAVLTLLDKLLAFRAIELVEES